MVDEYEVALSFAGEQRAYVERVAAALQADGVPTFYDGSDDETVRLWGKDLIDEFHRIYSSATSVVVMFISAEYVTKAWPNHERQSALSRAINERREYVLPVRFDDAVLPGLPASRGFLMLQSTTPEELAAMIEKKLVLLGARLPSIPRPGPAWLAERSNRTPGQLTVLVRALDAEPVQGARVGAVRRNGTAVFGGTDEHGLVRLPLPARELVDVWVAHLDHPPLLVEAHDAASDLSVSLGEAPGRSGVLFETSTGYIDGLIGRLNPIVQGARHYVYADNMSVDGSPAQPADFELGKGLAVEDAAGNRRVVTFLAAIGDHSLIEVQRA